MTVEQAIEAARWKWQPYSPTEAALVSLADEVERLQEELKQSKNEAKSLAAWVWKHHYRESAPGWVLRDSVAGVISQIDNMVAGLSEENRTLTVEVERLRESKESDTREVEYLRGLVIARKKYSVELNAEVGRPFQQEEA